MAGEGIKKTPAYETPMTHSELEKWRLEFWGKLSASYDYSYYKSGIVDQLILPILYLFDSFLNPLNRNSYSRKFTHLVAPEELL